MRSSDDPYVRTGDLSKVELQPDGKEKKQNADVREFVKRRVGSKPDELEDESGGEKPNDRGLP